MDDCVMYDCVNAAYVATLEDLTGVGTGVGSTVEGWMVAGASQIQIINLYRRNIWIRDVFWPEHVLVLVLARARLALVLALCTFDAGANSTASIINNTHLESSIQTFNLCVVYDTGCTASVGAKPRAPVCCRPAGVGAS